MRGGVRDGIFEEVVGSFSFVGRWVGDSFWGCWDFFRIGIAF